MSNIICIIHIQVPPAQILESISYQYLCDFGCIDNHAYVRVRKSNSINCNNNYINNNRSSSNLVNEFGKDYNSINNNRDSNNDDYDNEDEKKVLIPLFFTYITRLLLITIISYLSNRIPCFGDVRY